MKTVIVIGSGPSGVIASLKLSERYEVILVDSNEKIGKKLLLTGNGKCNYWNKFINSNFYETSDTKILEDILTNKNIQNTYNYLESLGIYPTIKDNLYYPYSKDSNSIKSLLERKLKNKNIKFIPNFKVIDIKKENDKFIINNSLTSDYLVIATGGKTYPKTGSDGQMFEIIKNLGHNINFLVPTLTSFISDNKICKSWSGIRVSAKVSLIINDKLSAIEEGEVQLTENGVSGICIFNLSNKSCRYNNFEISIDFLPDILNFKEFLINRNNLLNNSTLEDFLESLLNYKLMFILLKEVNLDKDKLVSVLTDNELKDLENVLKNFKLKVVNNNDFNKAQVTSGGVFLKDINPQTMQSNIINNLYFIGEVLDVSGICGGFNLAFAFITGFIVGDNL